MVAPRRLHHPALDLGEPRGAQGQCGPFRCHRSRDLRTSGLVERRAPVIGAALRRVEDGRYLTGSARFVDDFSFAGMLYCAIVRSPHAHARIKRIETGNAGVSAIFTGRDMQADGVGAMRAGWVLPGIVEPPRWALARDTVRHAGEPVAAAFAESKALAEDAAEQIDVEYEPLPLLQDEIC